ncbi:MAG: CotS family spore coat protein [Defluviitaleaceae bacterium]|nr:CotS family spore coat protein [Defluviitaleaceae bacterium]
MDGLCTKILGNYDLDIKNIKKTKGYYVINCKSATYALRKTTDSPERIEFRCRVQRNLLNNDFKNIEKIYTTTEGSPFVLHEEQKYFLTDYIGGAEANFDDKKELSKILVKLAGFHQKSKGLVSVPDEFYAQNIDVRLNKMLSELSVLRKKINFSKGLRDFDLIFIKNYEYYEDNIYKALEIIGKSNYHNKMQEVCLSNSICHNLLKKETIVCYGDDIFFSAFSNCLVDHATSDIAAIISKYMKYSTDRHISVTEIIDMYSNSGHNSLSEGDCNIILARLLMPTGFLNAAKQYYMKKRSWAPSAVTSDLEFEINAREAFVEYIKPLFRSGNGA